MLNTPEEKTIAYWDAFSPYMEYLEYIVGITIDDVGPVIALMESPVLVVGASHGLLVEGLRQKGLNSEGIDISPQMVAYAEKRRGIKLFVCNANHMPFESSQFKTTFVNTGVLDYVEDQAPIRSIIDEVNRVTDSKGKIFVALGALPPQIAELLRYVGTLSGNQLMTRTYWIMQFGSKENKKEMLALIKKDRQKSIAGYLFRLLKVLITAGGRTSERLKYVRELQKQVISGNIEDPMTLLNYLPERTLIRTTKDIEDLFTALNFPPRHIFVSDNCKIAQLK